MKCTFFAIPLALVLMACTQQETPGAKPAAVQPDPSSSADAGTPPAVVPAPQAPVSLPLETAPASTDATDIGDDSGDQAVNDAIDAMLGDHVKYQTVIIALQAAVAADDARTVAALADYPISVTINGKKTSLKDQKAFTARYREFMTLEIIQAIVQTKYSDLFVNAKGVMFGSGQAWINGICSDEACKVFEVRLVTLQPAA